jgi:hypothetical protein
MRDKPATTRAAGDEVSSHMHVQELWTTTLRPVELYEDLHPPVGQAANYAIPAEASIPV